MRNDSDALYSHFSVSLAGIHDIQLMELATRPHSKKFLHGLKRCITSDLSLGAHEERRWTEQKNRGRRLFAPEMGGSYEVFNERPIGEEIALYCTQDVQFMPGLWAHYVVRLTAAWRGRVRAETLRRVRESQTENYDGRGRDRAFGPW